MIEASAIEAGFLGINFSLSKLMIDELELCINS